MTKETSEPIESGLEIAENPYISQDYKDDLTLLDLNLKVAAIAGWTDIKEWERKALKKAFVGTNKSHPELGIFVPNYIESLDAIAKVFLHFELCWKLVVAWDGRAYASSKQNGQHDALVGSTPAIALCKLLIEIAPTPKEAKTERIWLKQTGAVIDAVFV